MIGRPNSALVLLRLLLVASVVAPLGLVAGLGWSFYRAAYGDSRQQAIWTSGIAREHAARVFDTQELVSERVMDLLRGLDAAAIEASEAELHDRLGQIIADLPQFQSIGIIDRDGHMQVASAALPAPHDVDFSDRDYFRALKSQPDQVFISRVQMSRVDHKLFFGLARARRAADGSFDGVISIAISPSLFQSFYSTLVKEEGERNGRVLTMMRSDGQILVRYPPLPGPAPSVPNSDAFMAAAKQDADSGVYRGRSQFDEGNPDRIHAYRHVEGYPLYVIASRNLSAIRTQWLRRMGLYLSALAPPTVILWVMVLLAIRRTRREATVLAQLRAEMTRREQAEDALRRAQRLEAVGQLTGGIAHDFNNLLTIIVGNVDMMVRRSGDPERVKRLGGNVLLAAKRVADVTDKLLAFSRRRVVRPSTIDVNVMLDDLQPLLSRAVSHLVHLSCRAAPDIVPVRVDPGQFEAALINLVVNARDAMPEGGRIVLSTEPAELTRSDLGEAPELAPGRYAIVAVDDTGSGMSPDTVAKAFEPFFTTKDIGKGTGLGLSQVYGFAKQAGGHARIISRPGHGTRVELILPLSSDPVSTDHQREAAAPPRRALRSELVLVVEDEPSLRETAIDSLQDLGYRTLWAENATQALAQIRQNTGIDVLFTDIIMPGGMDGIELVRQVRDLRPDLPVLLTSGYGDGDAEHRLPGNVPLLRKPYLREQLAAELGRLLAAADQDDTGREATPKRPQQPECDDPAAYPPLSRPSRNNR